MSIETVKIENISSRQDWENAHKTFQSICQNYDKKEKENFDFTVDIKNLEDSAYLYLFFNTISKRDAQNNYIDPRLIIHLSGRADDLIKPLIRQYKSVDNKHISNTDFVKIKSATVIINLDSIDMLEPKDMLNLNRESWLDIREYVNTIVLHSPPQIKNLKILYKIDNNVITSGKIKINATINDSFDVNNLRYYFPLKKAYGNVELNIEVKESDEFRVRQLLSSFDCNTYSIKLIVTSDYKQQQQTSASNLFPLLEIGDKIVDQNDQIFKQRFEELKNFLEKICCTYINSLEQKTRRDYKFNQVTDFIKDIELFRTITKYVFNMNIEPISKKIKELDLYKKYFDLTKLFGSCKEKNFKNQDKNKEFDEMANNVYDLLEKFISENKSIWGKIQNKYEYPQGFGDYFSSMIFLYLIRNLIENKHIYKTDEIKEDNINIALLEKTVVNAKSYAEGLWQIIENAQKHSNGHTAYFGMRIYKADPNETMSHLQNEAKTREALWRKYWKNTRIDSQKNIFNKKENGKKLYTDFLEFYVVDSAVNESGEAEGVLDKIKNQKSLEENKYPNSISEIFDLGEDSYTQRTTDYYTIHYGMHWLKRHVDKLEGIMEIYSPVKEAPSPEKCLFSNSFKPKDFINSSENKLNENNLPNLYFTEYSILIPLNYGREPRKKNLSAAIIDYCTENDFYQNGFDKEIELYYKPIGLPNSNTYKIDQIELVSNLLKTKNGSNADKNTVMYSFDFLMNGNYTLLVCEEYAAGDPYIDNLYVEILAKAIFNYIYSERQKSQDKKIFISIAFKSKNSINEFVRLFAIFYEKLQISEKDYMENVQIALCLNGAKYIGVSFILAGKNFDAAYQTANNFVYYNADASLEFVPLLVFLLNEENKDNDKSKDDKSEENLPKIFPFDLFLEKDLQNDKTEV